MDKIALASEVKIPYHYLLGRSKAVIAGNDRL